MTKEGITLSRRFFLGGAISVLAASTFVPKVVGAVPSLGTAPSFGNMPTIKADGFADDTAGIGALLRREPVVFSSDCIGVDAHEGVTFHHGSYKITQTIEVPDDTPIHIEGMNINCADLPQDAAVFLVGGLHRATFAGTRGEMRYYNGNGRTLFLRRKRVLVPRHVMLTEPGAFRTDFVPRRRAT